MAFLTDTIQDTWVDDLSAYISHVSLHSDWSTTGTNELTGYSRQAITWTAGGVSETGTITNNGDLTWTISTTPQTIKFIGFWTAVSGGTFRGMIPVNSYAPTLCTSSVPDDHVHGWFPDSNYADDQEVVVINMAAGAALTDFTEGSRYFFRPAGTSPTTEEAEGNLYLSSGASGLVTVTAVERFWIFDTMEVTVFSSGDFTIGDDSLWLHTI